MLATEVLTAHHDELRSLMRRLAEMPSAAVGERQTVLEELVAELSLHEQVEDELFYPAMTAVTALVPMAHAEHRQLEDQVAVVVRTGPDDPAFDEEVRVLVEAVEHHAGKEEREMFAEVEAKVDRAELERLGDALGRRLAELRASRLTSLRLRAKTAVLRRT